MSEWYVYMVRAGDDSLYTGVAKDVERRLEEHREGAPRGARYLRGRSPLELVYRVRVGGRGLALRIETRIKRLDKMAKESLIEADPAAEELIERLDLEEE